MQNQFFLHQYWKFMHFKTCIGYLGVKIVIIFWKINCFCTIKNCLFILT
jgi:hypothetical protein